ncbi:PHP domain-containing protein [Halanaerobium sp.]|uniref:PHP domain-containing protein n=1 Tax=Halanaerobium sp. TaxID=1895664 RepID=UPI0025C16AAB|nr:PHP domain-containing protein [Halanaerobium sp.]
MLIDIHMHEKKYSSDSFVSLEEIVAKAKSIGLDGICITDHESNQIKAEAAELSAKEEFPVIVGAEVLTQAGDILVFGLNDLPKEKIPTQDLIDLVNEAGGIAIAAHPFRDNGRGVGEKIRNLSGLAGIETFNGSTKPDHNFQAYSLALELDLPCLGGSDTHVIERVGKFVTSFPDWVSTTKDLIKAVKNNEVMPVNYNHKEISNREIS